MRKSDKEESQPKKKQLIEKQQKDKCVWTNVKYYCEHTGEHICCHFCKSKTCSARCIDELNSCKYSVSNDFFNNYSKGIFSVEEEKKEVDKKVLVDSKTLKAFRSYIKLNKLKINATCELFGITYQLCKKLIEEEIVYSRKSSYEKIKSRLEEVKK